MCRAITTENAGIKTTPLSDDGPSGNEATNDGIYTNIWKPKAKRRWDGRVNTRCDTTIPSDSDTNSPIETTPIEKRRKRSVDHDPVEETCDPVEQTFNIDDEMDSTQIYGTEDTFSVREFQS